MTNTLKDDNKNKQPEVATTKAEVAANTTTPAELLPANAKVLKDETDSKEKELNAVPAEPVTQTTEEVVRPDSLTNKVDPKLRNSKETREYVVAHGKHIYQDADGNTVTAQKGDKVPLTHVQYVAFADKFERPQD